MKDSKHFRAGAEAASTALLGLSMKLVNHVIDNKEIEGAGKEYSDGVVYALDNFVQAYYDNKVKMGLDEPSVRPTPKK